MSLSYRARRRLRLSLTTIGIILGLALTFFTGWMVWLDRFIIYTREGAHLDFNLEQSFPEGTLAVLPDPLEPVKIIVQNTTEDNSQAVVEQVSINGYYIDTKELRDDIPGIIGKLQMLPEGTAVMLDMKSTNGSFYYPTAVGTTVSKDIDQEQMDKLLELIAGNKLHAIARIPAFRDWEYGLNNVPLGLPKKGGNGSLWMDDKNCYWLNPAKDEVLSYLISIVSELKGMGFDEVVFTDFRFPDTDKITFTGNKSEAIAKAAATIAEACAGGRFFVSFESKNYSFSLPKGNTRLYLQKVPAADIPLVRQEVTTENPAVQLMFLTEANDTRYNDYCVLRPLSDMIINEEPSQD